MRPAHTDDQPGIAAMVRARAAWMRNRGLDGADGWSERADDLAAQAADPDFPVWACLQPDHDNRIVGITSLYTETPPWGWTEAERAQPALFLATTVTHPDLAGQRLGCLIAWWSLDYAAHAGLQAVRRGCGYQGLLRYYRDVQGWRHVHTVDRHGVPAYLLSRRAEHRPDLTGQIIHEKWEQHRLN